MSLRSRAEADDGELTSDDEWGRPGAGHCGDGVGGKQEMAEFEVVEAERS